MIARDADAETTLRLERTLPARQEKVFKAWTDPAQFKRWFCPTPQHEVTVLQMEVRVGGRYLVEIKSPQGVLYRLVGAYRVVEPPRKLVFTWRWEEGYPEAGETHVSVEFYARGEATRLVLTHERFPSRQVLEEHQKGWGGCLDNLARSLEGAGRE